ncbi:MAG: exlusion protein FxsA, partial [Rhodobacteraceae bacterium]|nr:exlusion protein FxsA [Paracoccaceae bacterium]
MWLFLLFIAVPIVEIALFIKVGGFLGVWPTICIITLTAVLGTTLVKQQGLAVIQQIKN